MIIAQESRPTALEVRLLGSFEVRRGEELVDLHHRKADLLFACLAVFGNWVDRGLLENLLWPELTTNPIDKAAGIIREALGESSALLEVRRGKLRLWLKAEECDVTLFDLAVRQRENEQAQNTALTLYNGPLLPYVEASHEALPASFLSWLLKERQRREIFWKEALERAVQRARDRGQQSEALPYVRRYVQEYPLSEKAWILYLRTTIEMEDRLEGISAYEQYQAGLHIHGLRPSPHVEELYCRLLSQAGHSSPKNHTMDENYQVGGAMLPGAPNYVERLVDHRLEQVLRQGESSILVVKGPRETGKSSLVGRSLYQERARGALTLRTDFKALPRSSFETTQSLCLAILFQLNEQLLQLRGSEEDTTLDEQRIAKIPTLGLEQYIQKRVLNQNPESSVVWAIDRVDRLFGMPCGHDFFSLLRSWHDKRTQLAFRSWRRLTLILVTATEANLFLRDAHQSPFNVGLQLEMEDFTQQEVHTLNGYWGNAATPDELDALFQLLSGHPYLTNVSLRALRQGASLDQLLPHSGTEGGIYGAHLTHLWEQFGIHPEYGAAIRIVLSGSGCPTDVFFALRSAGVLAGPSSDKPRLRCPLYANYLRSKLER